mgnify:CR=1 FL=1
MKYAEVVVEIAAENVSRLFTYAVPEGMALAPGTRVLAPFGPRRVEGYALRIKDDPGGVPPEKIREIIRPLEDYPALLPELVDDLPDESALMVVPSTGKITEMAFNSSSALPLITS